MPVVESLPQLFQITGTDVQGQRPAPADTRRGSPDGLEELPPPDRIPSGRLHTAKKLLRRQGCGLRQQGLVRNGLHHRFAAVQPAPILHQRIERIAVHAAMRTMEAQHGTVGQPCKPHAQRRLPSPFETRQVEMCPETFRSIRHEHCLLQPATRCFIHRKRYTRIVARHSLPSHYPAAQVRIISEQPGERLFHGCGIEPSVKKPHSLYHHIQACPVQHRKPPFATRLCPGSPYHLRLHTSNPISPQDKQLPATMLSVRILFRHRPDRAGATAYGQNRINAPAYRPVVTTRRPTTPPASGTEKSAPAPARHSRQNMA